MICLKEVRRYCKEYWLIENYDKAMADKTQIWHCHHRHEIDWALPMDELIAIGRYYDVHYSELIFLTPNEHKRLHRIGSCHTEEAKQKMSESHTKILISAEELYNMYVVQGLSTLKIAKMYGCYHECIRLKLKKFNILKSKV